MSGKEFYLGKRLEFLIKFTVCTLLQVMEEKFIYPRMVAFCGLIILFY